MASGSLEQQVIDADEARRLLDNPILKDAFIGVRDALINAMHKSAMGDDRTHNRLVIALQILGQIEGIIKTKIQTGEMAEVEIQETLREKVRKFARF